MEGSLQIFPAPGIVINPASSHTKPFSQRGKGPPVSSLNPPQTSPRPAKRGTSNVISIIESSSIGGLRSKEGRTISGSDYTTL